LTKATGRHDRFHYAGSPGADSADVEARSGPKLALEPQQRADCDENNLRCVRASESYSDVILRLARDAKRWRSPLAAFWPRPHGAPRPRQSNG
jgi:hypothetical protein